MCFCEAAKTFLFVTHFVQVYSSENRGTLLENWLGVGPVWESLDILNETKDLKVLLRVSALSTTFCTVIYFLEPPLRIWA